MKKRIFFSLSFWVLLLCLSHRVTIVETVAHVAIPAIARYYQSSLCYEKLVYKEGRFYFTDLSILDLRTDRALTYQVEVDKAQLTFFLKKGVFVKDIQLDGLQVTCFKKQGKKSRESTELGSLSLDGISVDKGVLELVDLTNPRALTKRLEFGLHKQYEQSSLQGFIKIDPDKIVELGWTQEGICHNFDLRFHKTQGDRLFDILSFFVPKKIERVQSLSGLIEGSVSFSVESSQIKRFWLDMSLKDFAAKDRDLVMSATSLNIRSTFEDMPLKSASALSEAFWPKKYQNIGLNLEVEEGFLSSHLLSHDIMDLYGAFSLSPKLGPRWELEGIAQVDQIKKPFEWEGKGYLYSQRAGWLDTNLVFEGDEGSTQLILKLEDISDTQYRATASFNDISTNELKFIRPLLYSAGIEIESGIFSAEVIAECSLNQVDLLNIYHCRAKDFIGRVNDYNFAATNVKAALVLDLIADDLRTGCSGYFECQKGQVEIGNKYQVRDIEAELVIDQAQIMPSYLSASSDQLKSRMTFSGSLFEIKTAIDVEGKLNPIMSTLIGRDIQLPDNILKAMFYCSFCDETSEIMGDIALLDNQVSTDHLFLNFLLKNQLSFLQNPASSILSGALTWENVHLEKFSSFLPIVDIEKWGGVVSGKASFKPDDWFFSLYGKGLEVQTPTFHVQADTLDPDRALLIHLDPFSSSIESVVALQGATCYLPKFDLVFEDVSARASLANNAVLIDIDHTKSKGMAFIGKVLVDLADIEAVGLEISTDYIGGDFDAAKDFLSHFNLDLISGIDLKAKLESGESGFYLSTRFSDDFPGVLWGINAHLSEGSYALSEQVHLKNFRTSLHWSSKNHDISFTDTYSNLCFNECKSSYYLNIPSFVKKNDQYQFDFRIANDKWDFFRAMGSAERAEDAFSIIFDPKKTHFFGSHFLIEGCKLRDDLHLSASIQTNIDLKTVPSKLRFISDSRLLSRIPQKLLSPMKGKIELDLSIDTDKQSVFSIKSQGAQIGDLFVDYLSILASHENGIWNIKECITDELTTSFSLKKKSDYWELGAFKTAYKNAFSFSMLGTINNQFCLDANIDSLCVNLEYAKLLGYSQQGFLSHLNGSLSGKGHLIGELSSFDIDTKIDFDAPRFSIEGMNIVNHGPISMSYSNAEGLNLQGLNFHFEDCAEEIKPFRFQVESLRFDREEKNWDVHNLDLILPKDTPKRLCDWFDLDKIEKNISLDEELHLLVNGSFNPTKKVWQFSAHDLVVPLVDQPIHLQQITFYYDQRYCETDFLFLQDKRVTQVQSQIELQDIVRGQLRFLEKNLEIESEPPLEVVWQWKKQTGLELKSIQGSYSGLVASLFAVAQNEKDTGLSFSGSLGIDFQRCRHLLEPEMQEMVDALQLGEGFQFKGLIHASRSISPKLHWKGLFTGKHCELLGFEFKTLLAELSLNESSFQLSGLKISDTAGIVKIDELNLIEKSHHERLLCIPNLTVLELRPSLLRKRGQTPSEIQPLVVRSFHMSDFKGNLNDPKSFTAKGSMSFINSFKRGYTVFDIPSDLLGRIFGVDQELLIPVQGKVDCEIRDGKCYLTALNNAFSENDRSEFFFDSSWPVPYIGFDGNLEIYIKMKHYVLFKFTENFVLSIQGSISDPHFELTRKKKVPQLDND